MPGKVTFKVEGAREIERAMRELGIVAAGRIARSALNRSGTVIVRRARELAPTPGDSDDPYATGLLKRSISKRLRRLRRGSSRQNLLIGIEKPRSRIAHLLEFGSSRQAAEPFLRPALDEKSQEMLTVMQKALRDGIAREINKLSAKTRK